MKTDLKSNLFIELTAEESAAITGGRGGFDDFGGGFGGGFGFDNRGGFGGGRGFDDRGGFGRGRGFDDGFGHL
jgi:hypothetical protein